MLLDRHYRPIYIAVVYVQLLITPMRRLASRPSTTSEMGCSHSNFVSKCYIKLQISLHALLHLPVVLHLQNMSSD
jgi:hypothetical protein